MEKPRFWILTLIGIIVTPLFFWASTYTGRGTSSHAGGGFQMFVFYPIPVILAVWVLGKPLGIVLAALQFPAYGFTWSYLSNFTRSHWFILVKVMILLHVLISLLGLGLTLFPILLAS